MMYRGFRSILALATLAVATMSLPTFAQGGQATLTGTITDATGAIVPGA